MVGMGLSTSGSSGEQKKTSNKIILITIGVIIALILLAGCIGIGWLMLTSSESEESTVTAVRVTTSLSKVSTTTSVKVTTVPVTTTTTSKPTTTTTLLDFDDLNWCSSKATDLQKKDVIEKNKGMYITGEGEVSSVSESWGSLSLQVKHCSSTLTSDILITMKKDQKDKLLLLSEGDLVRYKAKISGRVPIFGSVSADEGEILSSESESRVEKCQRQLQNDLEYCREGSDIYCYQEAQTRNTLCMEGY